MATKVLTEEEKNIEKKKKQLAILKASNALLDDSKEKILNSDKLTDLEKSERIEQIETAKAENIQKGATYLHSTKKDIDEAQYNNVSDAYIKKYEKHLSDRGLTKEMVERKEQAATTYVSGNGTTKQKRERKRGEKPIEDIIVRVDGEEEIMKKSMANDNKTFNEKKRAEKVQSMKEMVNETIDKEVKKSKKVSTKDEVSVVVENKKTEEITVDNSYDFDFSSIPSHVQYDVIPLPSKGECYSHKKSRIPVAYLTASDENIIASPNVYRDGKVIDIILKRKILDKTINVDDLCKGDRDAIALWLRATGYGVDFPVIVTNPNNGNKYDITVKLDSFDYLPFTLKGDENGYFEYNCNGDLIRFKFMSAKDEEILRNIIFKQNTKSNVGDILKYSELLSRSINGDNLISDDLKDELNGCVEDINEIVKEVNITVSEDEAYSTSITEQMILYTMSINGNDDKEYIRNYIENMRARDARDYRNYVLDNRPGVDFGMKVNIPESDGGGSFDTFLRIDDTVFINI